MIQIDRSAVWAPTILNSRQALAARQEPESIDRYSELKRKRRKSSEEKIELDQLRVQLNDLFSSAETPLERQIETAVQKVLTQPKLLKGKKSLKRPTVRPTQPLNADAEELRLRIRGQLNRLFRK